MRGTSKFEGSWEPLIPAMIKAARGNDVLGIALTEKEYKRLKKEEKSHRGEMALVHFGRKQLPKIVADRIVLVEGDHDEPPVLLVCHLGTCP